MRAQYPLPHGPYFGVAEHFNHFANLRQWRQVVGGGPTTPPAMHSVFAKMDARRMRNCTQTPCRGTFSECPFFFGIYSFLNGNNGVSTPTLWRPMGHLLPSCLPVLGSNPTALPVACVQAPLPSSSFTPYGYPPPSSSLYVPLPLRNTHPAPFHHGGSRVCLCPSHSAPPP